MEWAFTNLRRAHVDSSFLKNSASSNRKEYLKADWHSKSVLVEITRFTAHRTRQSSAWLRCQRPDAEQWLFLWLQLCLHQGICLGGGFGWLSTSRLCAKSPSCNDASGQRSDKRGKEPAISYLQHPGGTEVPGACPPPPQHPVGIGRPASCTLHSSWASIQLIMPPLRESSWYLWQLQPALLGSSREEWRAMLSLAPSPALPGQCSDMLRILMEFHDTSTRRRLPVTYLVTT